MNNYMAARFFNPKCLAVFVCVNGPLNNFEENGRILNLELEYGKLTVWETRARRLTLLYGGNTLQTKERRART